MAIDRVVDAILEEMATLQSALDLLTGKASTNGKVRATTKRTTMSDAGRRAISAAMKKRWREKKRSASS